MRYYHAICHVLWRIKWLLGVALPLMIGWLVGLIWFIDIISAIETARHPSTKDPYIEAIVVVTGGDYRVRTGLELLAQGYANHLFISGVHPQVTLDTLLDAVGSSYRSLACCIDLGYAARDTIGNAVETIRWIEEQNYTSFYLVTDSYHMPRTLIEFTLVMSDIRIISYTVLAPSRLTDTWWYPRHFLLLATEYSKFLLTRLRQWRRDMSEETQ